jgi:hypothetical protein
LRPLKATSGKIAGFGGAAESLRLKRTTLQNKMRRLHILKPDYTRDSLTDLMLSPLPVFIAIYQCVPDPFTLVLGTGREQREVTVHETHFD